MADFTKRIVFIILYWISQVRLISASKFYCEFGVCKPDEYCCDRNVCCPKDTGRLSTLLFVLGGIITAVILYYIFKFRYYLCRKFVTHPEEKPIMA